MQKIIHIDTSALVNIVIERVTIGDYKLLTKERYFFDWKKEKDFDVFKLTIENSDDILGLLSLKNIEQEHRFEIKLLATSIENCGKNKTYEGIAENLIAYACRLAVLFYAENGCVSLLPKTELKQHYIQKYGMLDAGKQLYLEGKSLLNLLEKNGL